jgi:hypothetical protein
MSRARQLNDRSSRFSARVSSVRDLGRGIVGGYYAVFMGLDEVVDA